MNDACLLRPAGALARVALLGVCVLGGPAADAGAGTAATAPPPPAAAREFSQRLAKAGRAEASLTRRFEDPLRGGQVVMHGRLVLEPPDRARIEFDETGERVTLRADGGEWLQPQLEQMVRFGQSGAMGALRWWTLFGGVTGAGVRERRIGPREWVITMPASGVAGDSARVELDAAGLPRRIRIVEEAGAPVEYRLEGWRFTRPRGRAAFVIQAPPGYEVFDLE
jgi:outer membrane lipoprotein-sorting protein